jgi:creatinine amidohydrolase/Fe(II)-dependent formamide hydrolase-like protein
VATTNSRALVAALLALCVGAAGAQTSLHLEALTWVELRDQIAAGKRIALVPIGGTEQNGPHMTLGKHNLRVRLLAERIAARLGDALVAPVLAYVPEGAIAPPQAHMRWPGTITVPEPAFEAVLESAARSLLRAGFTDVVLLGDHGGYRASLDRVASRVPHVHALPEYYRAAQASEHAGLADTSLMLALEPSAVRLAVAQARAPSAVGDGAAGDARRASAQAGQVAVERIVDASVAAIRARTAARPQSAAKP